MWASGEGDGAEVSYWAIPGLKKLAQIALAAGLSLAGGLTLLFVAEEPGVEGKRWAGLTICLCAATFGVPSLWRALKIERRAIRRVGDLLVIEAGGGRVNKVRFEDVASVNLTQLEKRPEREGSGLIVTDAGDLRDAVEQMERPSPQGSGVRLRLKSGEAVSFGQDLGPRKTQRLLRELKERLGLPAEVF